MCVPLVSKGKNIGVLMLNHPEPNAFEPELLPTMRVLASYLAIAIENAGMFGLVKSLAEKDSLTLLYNHGAFHEKLAIELERANRYVRPMAVIILDLDHFKEINDRYGHTTGTGCSRWWRAHWEPTCGRRTSRRGTGGRVRGDPAGGRPFLRGADRGAYRRGDLERPAGHRGESVISFTASIGYASCAPDAPGRGRS